MPTFEGDVLPPAAVVVPFPYSDRLAQKRRTIVVESSSAVAAVEFVWIATITSARHAAKAGDLPIDNLACTGLRTAAVVRPVKIACIERGRIVRRIGELPRDAAEKAFTRIRNMVG